MTQDNPCRNCENRHSTCHVECEYYKQYKVRREEKKERERQLAENDRFLMVEKKRWRRKFLKDLKRKK